MRQSRRRRLSRLYRHFIPAWQASSSRRFALAAALEHEDIEQRESARTTLRGFIDQIVIPPGDALLQVVGNLGEMLTGAGARHEAAAVGNSGCGGRNPLHLEFAWTAA